MNHSIPQVSVLMSVYNGAQYLREAVESILNQTFDNFEFIIADDGSLDKSLSILKEYAEKDSRIHLISRENKGLTKTLNELIDLAKGQYVARMDSDDVAICDRFARQVSFLEQYPNVLCVGGAYEMIDHRGKLMLHIRPPVDDSDIQQHLLSGSTAIQHPCAMVRRSALNQVGGYDETLKTAQDIDLWLRLGEIGELANLQEVVLKYRVHAYSVSGRRLRQQSQNVREACERAWKRRGIQGRCENAELRYQNLMLQCGWQAFNCGQRRESIAYGVRAIRALPLHAEGWRLLICAVIKPLPEAEQ